MEIKQSLCRCERLRLLTHDLLLRNDKNAHGGNKHYYERVWLSTGAPDMVHIPEVLGFSPTPRDDGKGVAF